MNFDVIIFEKNEDIVTISYTGPVSGSPVIDDDDVIGIITKTDIIKGIQ